MRTVAILGRPNVGKSTLFNRLVGRRQAIVDDTPGVTRDRLEGLGHLAGLVFRLIDTAGIDTGDDDLATRLRKQTLIGLAEADLGLFLIDARTGILPDDAEVADILRRQDKPIILLANKAESGAASAQAQEAWSLGLGEPIPVSARENEGFADLFEAMRPHVESEDEDEARPPERPVRFTVIGRPNVGKSSLINRLLDEERLLTGPEPGLTRDSVRIRWTWQDRQVELVDTAGLRRKARVDAGLEKLSTGATLQSLRTADVVALVIDATQPFDRQDLTIARLAIQEGRAMVVAVNKWDLVEDRAGAMAEIERALEQQMTDVAGVSCIPLSAMTGRGVEKLLPALVEAHRRWSSRVTTGALNRWLESALERHTPPLAQNRRIKIRYGTQTSSRPPTFVLFTNKPADAMPTSYVRYLIGSLRESFDLGGVPIRLELRHGKNPYDGD